MPDLVRIGVIGIDHRHIYTMLANMLAEGAELAGWWTQGTPVTLDGFRHHFPQAERVDHPGRLLDDPAINLILTSAIPADRAGIAVKAMRNGKDVMTDKPGCLTLDQLDRIEAAATETGRIWSVDFSERFEVPAMTTVADLITDGAVGTVVQTLGFGPHRLNRATRPGWFWDPAQNGGILTDIGSHQIDQFLALTGARDAKITLAETRNVAASQNPEFRDFGQIVLQSGAATGYIRLDWFTPEALPTWGDGWLFVLGTEGSIEVRKYVDVGGAAGGDHVFLTNGTRCERIDASGAGLPYFGNLMHDVRYRTETAMLQTHAFRVMELAIKAQMVADSQPC